MTKEQVIKEFKDFTLTENELDSIVKFYVSGANLLSLLIGNRMLEEELPIKLTLNSLKHTVVLMLELGNGKKKRQTSGPSQIQTGQVS
jgi:hypothetical protein